MIEKILQGVKESPEQALQSMKDFLNIHRKTQSLGQAKRVILDEYHSGNYEFIELAGDDGYGMKFYIYDEETWCRGCDYNCGRVSNTFNIGKMWPDSADKLAATLKRVNMEVCNIGRNILLGGSFRTSLKAYRGRDTMNGYQEWAKLSTSDGYSVYSQTIAYRDAVQLIKEFREVKT